MLTSILVELAHQVQQGMRRKIGTITRAIQHCSIRDGIMLFDILQHDSAFANSFRTPQCQKRSVPIDFQTALTNN